MDDFVINTSNFFSQVNNSIIERGQFIDAMEILLERLEDASMFRDGRDNKDLIKACSLCQIILTSLKNNQAADEDISLMFEQHYLRPRKRDMKNG